MMIKGISNIGNTCYLNSALQILTHLPLSVDTQNECPSFFSKIKEIHKMYNDTSVTELVPKDLLIELCKVQTDFQYLNMCDSQEALYYMMDHIHDVCGTKDELSWEMFFKSTQLSLDAGEYWKKMSCNLISDVSRLFTFQLHDTVYCTSCEKMIQDMYPINIHYNLNKSEIELINSGESIEKIDDYKCEHCHQAGGVIKKSRWNYMPEYLIFYNKTRDFFLKDKIVLTCMNHQYTYRLQMTINHIHNHYVSCIKHNEYWYVINDNIINKCKEIHYRSIYLYVFKKEMN